jgi:hypothetical protein
MPSLTRHIPEVHEPETFIDGIGFNGFMVVEIPGLSADRIKFKAVMTDSPDDATLKSIDNWETTPHIKDSRLWQAFLLAWYKKNGPREPWRANQ